MGVELTTIEVHRKPILQGICSSVRVPEDNGNATTRIVDAPPFRLLSFRYFQGIELPGCRIQLEGLDGIRFRIQHGIPVRLKVTLLEIRSVQELIDAIEFCHHQALVEITQELPGAKLSEFPIEVGDPAHSFQGIPIGGEGVRFVKIVDDGDDLSLRTVGNPAPLLTVDPGEEGADHVGHQHQPRQQDARQDAKQGPSFDLPQ